jgi:hypothetical protein
MLYCVYPKERDEQHASIRSELTTMPNTGFIARFAIPVLKAREVISRMAVPVVSEPVPAVVGTAMSGRRL